jgi:hypothetical protein
MKAMTDMKVLSGHNAGAVIHRINLTSLPTGRVESAGVGYEDNNSKFLLSDSCFAGSSIAR